MLNGRQHLPGNTRQLTASSPSCSGRRQVSISKARSLARIGHHARLPLVRGRRTAPGADRTPARPERRRQRRHPANRKSGPLARAPDHLWSWDITNLMGPAKWTYLCVILDIFSRRVAGWIVEQAENIIPFKRLFHDVMIGHAVPRAQLTLHVDRGAPMKAKATSKMLVDPGVLESHNRPPTSTDSHFPEAQFKTLKYGPEYPARFETIDDVRAFCRRLKGVDAFRSRCWIDILFPKPQGRFGQAPVP